MFKQTSTQKPTYIILLAIFLLLLVLTACQTASENDEATDSIMMTSTVVAMVTKALSSLINLPPIPQSWPLVVAPVLVKRSA